MAFESGITELPDNSVVCIEEDPGVIKETFILKIAADAAISGKKVVYLTTRMRADILHHMDMYHIPISENFYIIDSFRDTKDLMKVDHGTFCVMDSFSTMFSRSDLFDLEQIIKWLITESRKGATFALLFDTGVLPKREEQILRALCDGVIQFITTIEADRLRRYINIPKMKGMFPSDRMLPITVSSEGILIDTRERHG